ncbi:hypothetical protein MMC25_005067 [Agyrium rufum]|nr:hypothetical protein [Agyrium rufum]
MSFHIIEAKSEEEFSPLIRVEWEAYDTPPNAFWDLLKGPSIEECTQRQWAWHGFDPNSRWLKVVDSASGQVVGGGQWVINREDPFKKPMPSIEATWWPEENIASSEPR